MCDQWLCGWKNEHHKDIGVYSYSCPPGKQLLCKTSKKAQKGINSSRNKFQQHRSANCYQHRKFSISWCTCEGKTDYDPVLEAVFSWLQDLLPLCWSSIESRWRGCLQSDWLWAGVVESKNAGLVTSFNCMYINSKYSNMPYIISCNLEQFLILLISFVYAIE